MPRSSPILTSLTALSLVSTPGCGNNADDPPVDLPGAPPAGGGPEGLCRVSVECYGAILDDPKSPCSLQAIDPSGATMYEGAAAIELRGRSSLTFPKPQFAVELRDHTELPVWPGATWRYLDDGSDQGTAWRTAGYDDSGWQTGPAPLGHAAEYLQTEVRLPPEPSVTTYFRGTFSLGSPAEVTGLDIGVKRIDGVAVYLNGVEVLRDNLAPGAGFDTLATAPSADREWRTVDVDPTLLVDGENLLAVEVHRATLASDMLVFDLYLEAHGDDRSVDLLGMGGEADWILNGQYVDRILWRNRLAYDLFQAFDGADRYATETRFCELELNGEYAGIYTLGERIERDDDRLDIGKGDQPGDTFIVKNDDDGESIRDNGVGYGFWQLEYPEADDPAAVNAVSEWLAGWEAAVHGPDPADPDTGIFAWLDLGSAVDWVILNELFKNQDAYLLSIHLWRDQDDKMRFVPWDLDLSLGSYPYSDCTAEGWVARTYWIDGVEYDLPFIQRMAEVPAFREALATRWRELRDGPLAEDAILERIAYYDRILAPALQANLARWPVEDIAFSTPSRDNWLCPVSSYEEEHANVLAFLSSRLAWIDENIDRF